MDTNTKYRRWGWGAVIGLIAVILIAGLVVALTMNKKPKTTDEQVASSETSVITVDGDENTNNSSANSNNGESGSSENGGSENENSSNNGASSSENKGESGTSSSEEKNTHDSSANSGSNNGTSSSDKSENGASTNKEMPKTGPVDATFAIIGMAVSAYLISLNVALAKEKVRK